MSAIGDHMNAKAVIVTTGVLAVLGVPMLFVLEHLTADVRPYTFAIVVLAFLSAGASLIVIAGRFLGFFAASDFWVALVMLLVLSPLLALTAAAFGVAANHERMAWRRGGIPNLETLGQALISYARDHDNRLPDAATWCDTLLAYDPSLNRETFHHPYAQQLRLSGDCHYAFNAELSGQDITAVSGETILVFEADGNWNLAGADNLLPTGKFAQRKSIHVFHMDGVVRTYYAKAKTIYFPHPKWCVGDDKPPRWQP